jgi:hypothetical protein
MIDLCSGIRNYTYMDSIDKLKYEELILILKDFYVEMINKEIIGGENIDKWKIENIKNDNTN